MAVCINSCVCFLGLDAFLRCSAVCAYGTLYWWCCFLFLFPHTVVVYWGFCGPCAFSGIIVVARPVCSLCVLYEALEVRFPGLTIHFCCLFCHFLLWPGLVGLSGMLYPGLLSTLYDTVVWNFSWYGGSCYSILP